MIDLKNYFDRVVLINLKRRPDRLTRIRKLLRDNDWPFKEPEIFEAIDGEVVPCPDGWQSGSGAWGCMRSHQHILERAIIDNVSSILILEDDICFADEFRNKVGQFLRDIPDDWDQLMLGGQHINWNGRPILIKPGVYRCLGCERTHAYAIRGEFLRKLYRRWMSGGQFNGEVHCDWIMGRDPDLQPSHKVYSPEKFLVGQEQGLSDIRCSQQVRKFWNPPADDLPVIHLQAPSDVVKELRNYGLHTGNHRDKLSNYDVGLTKIFQNKRLSQEDIAKKFADWIFDIQWEVASDPFLICTVWHPEATTELVKRVSKWPVFKVAVNSVEEVWPQLPEELRRKPRLPLAQTWVIHLQAPRRVMDEMRSYGWHNGFNRDDRSSLDIRLMDLCLESPSSTRQEKLTKLVLQLQTEAENISNGIAVIWHRNVPDIDVDIAVTCRLARIKAENTTDAMDQWHGFLENDYNQLKTYVEHSTK